MDQAVKEGRPRIDMKAFILKNLSYVIEICGISIFFFFLQEIIKHSLLIILGNQCSFSSVSIICLW